MFKINLSSASEIMKEKSYCQIIRTNPTFQEQIPVIASNNNPWDKGYSKLAKSSPLSQIQPIIQFCLIYPTTMKLGTVIPYLKKIEKIYESHDTTLDIF